MGGARWDGVIMDSNPPDDDHWWYEYAEVKQPAGWRFFSQPGGVVRADSKSEWHQNPDAENLANLPRDYYQRQLAGKPDAYIRIMLAGEYGTVADGRPVFPEFREALHVAPKPLEPIKGLKLVLGWDFGLTPACVIGQLTTRGQLRIIDELVAESIGIRTFTTQVVKPNLLAKYPGFTVSSFGDPAGNQRAQTDEKTCMDELRAAGIPTEAAPTNEFMARRECVAGFLSRLVDGDPGFILSPSCGTLRRALAGRYMFERVQVTGEDRFKDQPAKNKYSHPADALQYLCLGCDPVITSRTRTITVNQSAPTARGY
jgi:hypothetical protein